MLLLVSCSMAVVLTAALLICGVDALVATVTVTVIGG